MIKEILKLIGVQIIYVVKNVNTNFYLQKLSFLVNIVLKLFIKIRVTSLEQMEHFAQDNVRGNLGSKEFQLSVLIAIMI